MSTPARWATARLPLLLCLATLASNPAAAEQGDGISFATRAAAYEADIRHLDAIDPAFPEALEAHFTYAVALAGAMDQDCEAHIALAEEHYRHIASQPATRVLLPVGSAELAGLRQRIGVARTQCGELAGDELAMRERESLQASRDAVGAYRDANMYESMVISQYNVAIALHDMDRGDEAIAALREAIEMDRHYGLREDAEENLRKLAEWTQTDSSATAIAAALADFPVRKATFRFNWSPGDYASETVTDTVRANGSGEFVGNHAESRLDSHISRRGDDWLLEQRASKIRTTIPAVSDEVLRKLTAFADDLGRQIPGMLITREGAFKGIDRVDKFIAAAKARTDSLPGELFPAGDPRIAAAREALRLSVYPRLNAESFTAAMQVSHFLQVAMWLDATLEQGKWLQFDSRIDMPGTPQGFITQTIEVMFADRVPCRRKAGNPQCAELLFSTYPTEKEVEQVTQKLQSQGKGMLHYWARERGRVVIDPDTSRVYDMRLARHFYLSLGEATSAREMGSDLATGTDVTP